MFGAGQLPGEIDCELEIMGRRLIGECLGIRLKVSEGCRIGQREKLNCDAYVAEASS